MAVGSGDVKTKVEMGGEGSLLHDAQYGHCTNTCKGADIRM
jgi:hypothetical protein